MLCINMQCASTPERAGVEKRAGLLLPLFIRCTSALHPSNPVSRGNEKELLIQSDLCSPVPSLLLVPWVSVWNHLEGCFPAATHWCFWEREAALKHITCDSASKPQLCVLLCSYMNTCNAPDVAVVALSLPLALQHCYSSRAWRRGRWVVAQAYKWQVLTLDSPAWV